MRSGIVIEIHLYGNLRRYAENRRPMEDTVSWREIQEEETLASVLDEMGIPSSEINHIFVNAKLLVTRTSYGALYDYPQVRDTLSDWDLSLPLGDGDRIGLFGNDLLMLGM
jgi:hypothetical protein